MAFKPMTTATTDLTPAEAASPCKGVPERPRASRSRVGGAARPPAPASVGNASAGVQDAPGDGHDGACGASRATARPGGNGQRPARGHSGGVLAFAGGATATASYVEGECIERRRAASGHRGRGRGPAARGSQRGAGGGTSGGLRARPNPPIPQRHTGFLFFLVETTGARGYRTQDWTPHPCCLWHPEGSVEGRRTGSGQGNGVGAHRRTAPGRRRRLKRRGRLFLGVLGYVLVCLLVGSVVRSYSRALAQ